jgi:hypothetical protein
MPTTTFSIIGQNGPSMKLFGTSPLGGGIKGFMPRAVVTTDDDYADFEQQRFQLVQAWNTNYPQQLAQAHKGRVITPFRAVNNAGDLLSRPYYSCGGPCQTVQSVPNVYGLKQRLGGIQNLCDGTNVPPAACNTRFVYDSSDYSTFLKQQAMAKNYNDASFGGDNYKASQSAIRAVRRY